MKSPSRWHRDLRVANGDFAEDLPARLLGRLFLFFCPMSHPIVSLGDVQHHLLGSGVGYLFGLTSGLLRKSSPVLGVIRNLHH